MKEFMDVNPDEVSESMMPEAPMEELEEPNIIPRVDEREEAPEIGIIREMSPKKVLEQLRMNMKGWFWDYQSRKYTRVEGMKPLMNDIGISKYLSIMSSVITDIVTFSNYKEEEINNLVLFVCDKAIPVIHINYKDYGIQQKSDLQIIDIQIFNLTLGAFKKAVASGDRNVIRGTVTEAMMTRTGGIPSQQYPQERKGVLGRINPFGR